KQRYKKVASKVNGAWLISALNILNESEINFKQAKNKRLHVELTLIKLCYLNQALKLVNENGEPGKKKLVELVKPVSFRALQPVAERVDKEIKARQTVVPNTEKPSHPIALAKDEALLIIEKEVFLPAAQKMVADNTLVVKPKPLKNPRKSLKEIQESIALENKNSQEKELSEEELNIAWNLYIEELVKVNNHSAVSNFKQARLVITGDYRIEIITDNNLQQKFIEAERGELITHLR